MKRSSILKIAAACFSVALMASYVYLRAGGQPKAFPGSKSIGRAVDAAATTSNASPPDASAAAPPVTQRVSELDAVIYSSKSAPIVLPGEAASLLRVAATAPAASKPVSGLDLGATPELPVFFPIPSKSPEDPTLTITGEIRSTARPSSAPAKP